jgi:TonB-linked SusC/RagA family outer membrane protein
MKISANTAENGERYHHYSPTGQPLKTVIHIMRLSLVTALITAASLQLLSASVIRGQSISSTPIVLGLSNESIFTAIERIEKQTQFRFVYSNADLKSLKEFTLPTAKRSVSELLALLLSSNQFNVSQVGSKILITKPPVNNTASKEQRISGIVVDEGGEPLPGVTIRLKGNNTISTATDINGHFGINIPDGRQVLLISYIGYASMEQIIDSEKSYRISLKPVSGSLNEVQVIGYGTTTRKTSTGAISSITSEEIGNQTVSNPIQAMAGRISGMTVVQNNGLPGSNTTVRIRGNNTLEGLGLSGSLPLYVVDGVPFTNFNSGQPITDNLNSFGLSGANGGLSVFGLISPQDIERIDILKDADATAIYGARGANGVVMITTKQGKRGKSTLNANVYHGSGKVGRFVDMLSTPEYIALRKEAFKNDGITPTLTNAPDLLQWDQNATTDWQDLLLGGSAKVTDAQLSYSGGTERVKFFTSLNYRKEGTVFPGDMGSERLNGRLNLQTTSADNRFTTAFSVNYANDNTDLITQDISSLLSLPPNYPINNPDGTLYWGSSFTNPFAYLLKTYSNKSANFVANGDLKYNLFKGFYLKTNLGYTRTTVIQNTTNPLSSQNPALAGISNTAAFANNLSTNYIVEPQASYSININKHSLNALIGSSFQQNVGDANRVNGSNYAFAAQLNTINGAGTVTSTNNYSIYKYASVFGRLTYDFDKKYIANFTYRRDASSRFGTNNRFANFGAAGAAWVFSEEKFLKDHASFLSFGKLRTSYGTTGNDQLPNYSYLSLFSAGTAYQNTSTLSLNGLPNPDLKWETTKKFELGLDLGFFKDRLLLKADMYWHRSSDLLTYATISTLTGFNSINTNLDAVVQNKGLEFELSSTNIIAGDFKWSSAFNISFQRNKLLSFENKATSFYASSFEVGYPTILSRRFKYNGIDANTGAILYEDLDGIAGQSFTGDRYIVPIGSPFFGGLNNTFTYKGISLDVFFQFNHGMGITNQIYGSRIGSLNNQNTSVLSRWVNPGDTGTLFPGASANAGGVIYSTYNNFSGSDYFYGDNSWLKLRSANLSYNLPQQWIKSIKLTNARIYLQGQNLLTFSKNKYLLDPESGNALPPLRTIVIGANLTF